MNQDNSESIEQAVEWMIALQEEAADPARERAFLDWLNASEANARAWKDIQHTRHAVRAVAGALPKDQDVEQRSGTVTSVETTGIDAAAGSGRLLSPTRNAATWSRRRMMVVVAGAALAACLVFFVGGPGIYLRFAADHLTGSGELRKIVLEDGSIVHLGAESAVSVDYGQRHRKVTLLSGEAYFDVRKDSQRPFRVSFGNAETTVLGTAFEISLSSGGAAVAVERGAVLVRYPAPSGKKSVQQSELSKGHGIRLDWDGAVEASDVTPGSVASWRRGKLVVENWPITDVLDELKRHYRGTLVIGWKARRDERISGVYDLDDPVEAIELVAATYGMQVYQVAPWLLVIPSL